MTTTSFLELFILKVSWSIPTYDGCSSAKEFSQNLKLWSESGILCACRHPYCDLSLSESTRKSLFYIQQHTTDDRLRMRAACLRQRAKRWVLTTSLVAEMNNRNTRHKVYVWGKKRDVKRRNRIITLCFSRDSNVEEGRKAPREACG